MRLNSLLNALKKTAVSAQRQKEVSYLDFQLVKRIELPPHVLLLADVGYQGLAGINPNSQSPVKKTKLHPLDNKQKASNRLLSRKRIVIEHIFCKLKVFRMLRKRY